MNEEQKHSIFGMAGYLDSDIQILVLVILIIFIVLMDFLLELLGDFAKMYGLKILFETLKKDLTMLGIISFIAFLYIDIGALQGKVGMVFFSFETMHIILVFMGFAFVIQALLLLRFTVSQSMSILISQRISAKNLITLYNDMKATNSYLLFYYEHAPSWMPQMTSFRGDIENKIVEMHYKYIHNLSDDFPYPHYISKLLRAYISEVGSVSPICWFLLAFLAFINWIRSCISPNTFFNANCAEEVGISYDDDNAAHRMLANADDENSTVP